MNRSDEPELLFIQVTTEVAADSEVDANNQCVDMQPLDQPGPSHTSIEVSGCSRNVEENSSESDADLPPVSFTAPKQVYSTSCMSVTLFYACTRSRSPTMLSIFLV